MVQEITLNFSDKKNQKGTIKVENENVIKNIFSSYKDKTVTQVQFEQLQEIAKIAGNKDTLEAVDIQNIQNAKNRLKASIAKGEADYESWYNPENILSTLLSGSLNFEDEIIVEVPNGTTLGEVKQMFNLPDGALTKYAECLQHASGDRDQMTVDGGTVWFSLKTFAKSNYMNPEDVKKLFEK